MRPHGVRGALGVLPLAAGSRSLLEAREVVLASAEGPARRYRVVSVRDFEAGFLLELEGVDRAAAEALRGATVGMERAVLARTLEPGEYFVADLVGCAVEDPAGRSLGTVREILPLPAHDVLVLVRLDAAGAERERLVPLVDAFLVEVDVGARRVVLDPPEEEDG